MGPTRKYRGQQEWQGVPVYWDAHESHYPMKGGNGPLMTRDEVRGSELVANVDYNHFKLPQDREAYLKIFDLVANGYCQITREITTPDKDDPGVIHVHLWWVEYEAVAGQPVSDPTPRPGTPWDPPVL